MMYEANPKHKDPRQRGRKGSLCPQSMSVPAQKLLNQSTQWSDGKRYATCDGQAFCAQESRPGYWHGYPIGWREVPEKLRRAWRDEGKITKKNIGDYW
ncbi:MAG: hypothetical protein V1792_27915 [Pseudomonadota bacterium]